VLQELAMTYRWLAAFAMLSIVPAAQAASAECTAKSGPGTAALVELYTSEGCDSCPPADEWLRKLPAAGFGPERVVPLALHVDYWDYIGWKDPFAKALFSKRQRELAPINHRAFVYTPQVLLSGRDYRQWADRLQFGADVQTLNGRPARAELELALRTVDAGKLELSADARVPATKDRADAALFVAVYENGLVSRVAAGENRGVTLRHDYVAREWIGPIALDADGRAALKRAVALPAGARASGAVAFAQNRRNGDVLQALALPACRG
jgi:hypothetical protein